MLSWVGKVLTVVCRNYSSSKYNRCILNPCLSFLQEETSSNLIYLALIADSKLPITLANIDKGKSLYFDIRNNPNDEVMFDVNESIANCIKDSGNHVPSSVAWPHSKGHIQAK